MMAVRRSQVHRVGPLTPGLGLPAALPVGLPATPDAESASCLVKAVSERCAATKDMTDRGFVMTSPISPEGRSAPGTPESTPSEQSLAERSARPTRGPGTSGLLVLHDQLAPRDLAVLELLVAHRYLTTHHLERFLFHDHATTASGSRTCRRVLARLENWSLVGRPIRRVGGLQAGSAYSIWMLTSAGKRLLNLHAGLGAVGRVREPGERFIAHYLAIADTRLQLLDADRSRQLELGTVEIEPSAWRSYLGTGGQKETLKPDLYAVTTVRTASGDLAEFEDHWFIEVDRGTESIPTLLGQCRQYESYRGQGIEQESAGVFPLVLWIVPDQRRVDQLTAAIQRTTSLDDDLYRICTPTTLLDTVLGGAS